MAKKQEIKEKEEGFMGEDEQILTEKEEEELKEKLRYFGYI